MSLSPEQKQQLLMELDPLQRLESVVRLMQ